MSVIEADATAWTGRRPWVDVVREATLNILRRKGAGVLAREDAPGLYALLDEMARRAGLPAPMVVVDPTLMAAAALAQPALGMIRLAPRVLSFPQEAQAALIAHEMGHFAAGHCMAPAYVEDLLKPGSWMALAAALALGDVILVVLAVLAFVVSDMALRRHMARIEEEADRHAARLMGSVAALLALEEGKRSNPDTLLNRLTLWVGCYPRRRPWLARMAADEVLADFKRVMASGPDRV